MQRLFAMVGLFVLACNLYGAASCETYYPTSQILENDRREITDEEIRQAFESDPQLTVPLRIAWYNISSDEVSKKISIENAKAATNYYLPRTLIDGFAEPRTGATTTLNLRAPRH
jgi:hypothetical protein